MSSSDRTSMMLSFLVMTALYAPNHSPALLFPAIALLVAIWGLAELTHRVRT